MKTSPALVLILCSLVFPTALSNLLMEPVQPNTVPAFPVETQAQSCSLDLSDELFGGVNEACGRNLDRSRCCPVLAAWLFAAHARSALQLPAPAPSAESTDPDQPMKPDDSQKCVNTLQSALLTKRVKIPQPNATCDAILCFCGIRLHQISSLSCPAAFNVSSGFKNATPTVAVKNLEKECRNSSYSGCTRCLGALQKLKGKGGNKKDRASKMMSKDCQLMGLTWLLARNKTAYIPTVSAVLRAIMYSPHPPHLSKCSPDQENMPLAVDSLQFQNSHALSSSSPPFPFLPLLFFFLILF